MKRKPLRDIIFAVAALSTAACGGGGGSSSPPPVTVTPPTPTPPTTSTCSLSARQTWAFNVLNEWYLFPETLPSSLSTSGYSTIDAYVDALTATARSQNRDRYFTYVTSIREENAYYSSGSSAGFGFRLSVDGAARRAFIAESFEGAPALAAGIDRGTEILAIGTSASSLRSVSDIIASDGTGGVSAALGASTVGLTRVLRVTSGAGTRDVTISKTEYELTPVSSRYGALTLNDGGRKVGYINMRTFISTADNALRNAFANFRSQGVTDFIIDFRYNGGGLVSTAQLMSNLLGGNRTTSDVMFNQTFRTSKSVENETARFQPEASSVSPIRVAFIGSRATASASELVMNNFIPYLGNNLALVGTNTYGKPVGQIAIDQASCDDRMRVVAFSTQSANNSGYYFNGIASIMPNSCAAADDLSRPLGDPAEASVKASLDFIAGRSCTAITATGTSSLDRVGTRNLPELITPEKPSVMQRDVPGAF